MVQMFYTDIYIYSSVALNPEMTPRFKAWHGVWHGVWQAFAVSPK